MNHYFLADNCVATRVILCLRQAGRRVDRMIDAAPADLDDKDVLALADSLGAVLITQDNDFRLKNRFPYRRHGGIILLRDTDTALDAVLRRLLKLIEQNAPSGLTGSLVVIDRRSCRIKK
ncbi:MAG: DUF5615 family PIN-like protein [Armatimonadetes bacterium]|nr:DUF5615 family PIN-like protein [Armatimonadota bacterium]